MRTAALLWLLAACGVFAVEKSPSDHIKNSTAGGHYYPEHDTQRYTAPEYEAPKPPPLVDQFLCDLDATILVVASSNKEEKKEEAPYSGGGGNEPSTYGNGGGEYSAATTSYSGGGGNNRISYQPPPPPSQNYGGDSGGSYGSPPPFAPRTTYGGPPTERPSPPATPNAVRLKCSHIATRSEEDCQSCCQLSARTDQSVSRRDIFGFIINGDELNTGELEIARRKRNSDLPSPPPTSSGYQQTPSSGYGAVSPGYPAPTPGYAAAPAPAAVAAPPPPPPPPPSYVGTSRSSDYSPSSSGGGAAGSYKYFGSPKNRRCVCCAPKRHEQASPRQPQPSRRHRNHNYESEQYGQ